MPRVKLNDRQRAALQVLANTPASLSRIAEESDHFASVGNAYPTMEGLAKRGLVRFYSYAYIVITEAGRSALAEDAEAPTDSRN